MRAVLQRVSSASVSVDGRVVGRIGIGAVLLVGVAEGDTAADAEALASKVADLRVFADGAGRMNRSLVDVGGSVLLISQFTLLADLRRGRRPSFVAAAKGEVAAPLVGRVGEALEVHGLEVAQGEFGATMDVELVNSGPVTIAIEVRDGRVV